MSRSRELNLPPDAPAWMRRHPRWTIALVGSFMLLLVLLVVGVIANLINESMRRAPPYQQALSLASADPRLRAALGEPIDDGRWIRGRIDNAADGGSADLSVPLFGPRGRARLHVRAHKNSAQWTLSEARVALEPGTGEIDLLAR